MKRFSVLVTGLSRVLDQVAAFFLVATMLLVVVNILLRVLFKAPIFGAYEYVGLLTALVIGLALAQCSVQNGHIDVSLVVDLFPARLRDVVGVFINFISMCFLAASSWYVGAYARSMYDSGLVTPTTQTPIYPFVYLIALGLLVYSLVLLVRSIEYIIKAANNR
ncbi:MAG: TRAP transporter small permease [Desulfotomaculaceae bacterium]|nr:TRAP transporter small permease [Desulfotomaculaceae bacterium]MDD4767359.1 TRAP transporter small permease [Desulfotomaculaceae bacterium]